MADVKQGEELKYLNSGLSPAEQVQQAKDCLQTSETKTTDSTLANSFQRWTIMDYSRAYTAGEITPLMVS